MNMFGSFLPSLWSSKQPQSTRVEEPTLLCNHVDSAYEPAAAGADSNDAQHRQVYRDSRSRVYCFLHSKDYTLPDSEAAARRGGNEYVAPLLLLFGETVQQENPITGFVAGDGSGCGSDRRGRYRATERNGPREKR